MLSINPVSVISFVNIFSHSVGYLFILLMVSFAVQKLLSLIRPHLFIFWFYFLYFRRWSQEIIAAIYVRVLQDVLNLKNIDVLMQGTAAAFKQNINTL